MEEDQYYKLLVERFTNGTATNKELEVFIKLVNEGKLDASLTDAINEVAGITENDEAAFPTLVKRNRLWPRIAAAASVLLMIAVSAYFILHKKAQQIQVAQAQPHDIAPGHNQATLTLGNGQKIILSKGLSGKLAQQGNTQIKVNGSEEIVYSGSENSSEVAYNTLSTSKGEQSPYPLVLADGTKVWLNSNSSVTFPTAFAGKTREVQISGEAYFEVVHNAARPFKVKAGNQIVEDIGTSFNINSYGDEPAIKTTLVEGSAKVLANGEFKILKPGQRSIVTKTSVSTQASDSEAEIAWVGGKFIFHDEDLHSVMRQLARWYNIEVVYDYQPTDVSIDGRFSKARNISQILKAFVQTGAVKFKIKGNVVRVTQCGQRNSQDS